MGWKEQRVAYLIRDARIVATMGEDGGAHVAHADLEYSEGRVPFSEGPEFVPTLRYIPSFGVAGAADPLASVNVEARIVIVGQHENGRIEIRGDGWIGYDDKGNVEGTFFQPPMIVVGDASAEAGESDDDAERDALLDRIVTDPNTPEDYDRAVLRVSYEPDAY